MKSVRKEIVLSVKKGFTVAGIHPSKNLVIVGDCSGNVYSIKEALVTEEPGSQEHQDPVRLDDAGHRSHITCVAFSPGSGSSGSGSGGDKLVTASRDCKVCLFVPQSDGNDSEANGGTSAAYRFQSFVCRTESGMPVNHVEFNATGNRVCVASNEDCVRIVDIDENGNICGETRIECAHEGGCLQAEFDSSSGGRYLATLGVDKNVKIWDLSANDDGGSPKCVKTIRGVASKEIVRLWLRMTAEDDLLPVRLLQWTPDGKHLAVLRCNEQDDGNTYSISFFAIDTWQESTRPEHVVYKELLRDCKAPYMMRFSPNGVYLAVVDASRVLIFDHEHHLRRTASGNTHHQEQTVASVATGKDLVSSMQWCTFADAIVIGNIRGQVATLDRFLPESDDGSVVNSFSASHSKAMLMASLEGLDESDLYASGMAEDFNAIETDIGEGTASANHRFKASDFLDQDAEDDGDNGERTRDYNDANELEEEEMEEEDEEDLGSEDDDDDDDAESLSEIKARYRRGTRTDTTTAPQSMTVSAPSLSHSMFVEHETVQPGATPFDNENRRILAWNNTGVIVCTRLGGAGSRQQSIEIDFADLTKQSIRITDRDDLSMAALNDYGAIFAAKCNLLARPSITPSFIRFQPFKTRAQTNLVDAAWEYALPTGEEVECVAMAKEFVIVATSTAIQRAGLSMHKHSLRVFNIGGVQHFTYSLPARVVSVAGFDMMQDDHRCRLFVVMQDGFSMLSPTTARPNLIYTVLELSSKHQYSARVVSTGQDRVTITAGSKLSWIGFTQLGFLATVDTANIVRILSPDWSGWMEVLDLSQAFRTSPAAGDISFYVSSITDKFVMFYPCKNTDAIPPIVPRPVMDVKEFHVDMLSSAPFHEHERKYAVHSMTINHKVRTKVERGQRPEEDRRIGREEREVDKITLSMVFEAIESGMTEYALALCRQFRTSKAIALAKQPATEKKLFALVRRMSEVEDALFGSEDNRRPQIPNTDYPVQEKTVVVKETVVEKVMVEKEAPVQLPSPPAAQSLKKDNSEIAMSSDDSGDEFKEEDDHITTSTVGEMDVMRDDDDEQEVDFDAMQKAAAPPLFSPSRRRPNVKNPRPRNPKARQSLLQGKDDGKTRRISPFLTFKASSASSSAGGTSSLSASPSGNSSSGDVLGIFSVSDSAPSAGQKSNIDETSNGDSKKRKRGGGDAVEGEELQLTTQKHDESPPAKRQAGVTESEEERKKRLAEAQSKTKNWLEERKRQKEQLKKFSSDKGNSRTIEKMMAMASGQNEKDGNDRGDDDDDDDDEIGEIVIS